MKAHVLILLFKTRESNLLKVTINIEPTKVVKFYVTYEELLQRIDGRYQHIVTVTSQEVNNNLLLHNDTGIWT